MKRQRGFTLIETIVVMVITGILAGIMVLFITRPVRSYVDASARADLSDAADLVLRRMARELRAALPNSVRLQVVGNVAFLEYIPAKAGGRYLSVDDNATDSAARVLSFTDASSLAFSVVGPVPAASVMAANDAIVVYNLGTGFDRADAYAGGNRAVISNVTGNLVTLQSNPFALASPPNASPENRFQVVEQPVTFRCESNAAGTGTLRRVSGYGFVATQPVNATATTGALMANNVLACNFSVDGNGNLQTALVGLNVVLARAVPEGGLESVSLTHQIHVSNTP
jgi:MSHA biogenesis protein MshO